MGCLTAGHGAAVQAAALPHFPLNLEDLPARQGLMIFAKSAATYPNEEDRPAVQIRACFRLVAENAIWLR
ncbi:hypothetical protein [Streptomyces canus]|uniref:hypothetical protein n=1 Tax=Streptomyces canus TaxID=58343 RepID=UPI0033BB5CFF